MKTDSKPGIRITGKTITKNGKRLFTLPRFLDQTILFAAYNDHQDELLVGASGKPTENNSNVYHLRNLRKLPEGAAFHIDSNMLLDIFPLTIDIYRHSPFSYTCLDYREAYIVLGYQLTGSVVAWIWDTARGFTEFIILPGLEISSSAYVKDMIRSRLRPVIQLRKEDALHIALLDCGRADYEHYYRRRIPDASFTADWRDEEAPLPIHHSLALTEYLRSANVIIHFPLTRERAGSFFRVLRMGKRQIPRKTMQIHQ